MSTMTGTGTKDDPYKIAKAEDLLNFNINMDNAKYYAELTNDIDINDLDLSGSGITVKNLMLDGKGHKIKNIYAKNCSMFYLDQQHMTKFLNFKNVIFEGVITSTSAFASLISISSDAYYIDASPTGVVSDCEFRLKLFNNNNFGISVIYFRDRNRGVYNNTFNIDYYDSNYNCNGIIAYFDLFDTSSINNYTENRYVENNQININIYSNCSNNSISLIYSKYSSSYDKRKLYFYNNTVYIKYYSNIKTESYNSKKEIVVVRTSMLRNVAQEKYLNVQNCAFIFKPENLKGIYEYNYGGKLSFSYGSLYLKTLCVYDKDLFDPINTLYDNEYNSEMLLGLTTEQMKNKDYLNFIGFPVV